MINSENLTICSCQGSASDMIFHKTKFQSCILLTFQIAHIAFYGTVLCSLCRLNSAPVKGFEKDVGCKTTLRITYPEGAIQKPEQYEKDSLFVLAGFKWQDFKWLKYIVYKEKVVRWMPVWRSCPGISEFHSIICLQSSLAPNATLKFLMELCFYHFTSGSL